MSIDLRRVSCVLFLAFAAATLVACSGGAGADGDGPIAVGDADNVNLIRNDVAGGVVAYLDGEPITFEEVLSEAQAELNQMEMEKFRLLQSSIDRILARRLVDRAASADGIDPEAWLGREVERRVPQPTDVAVAQTLERFKAHPSMIGKSPEEQRELVIQEMTRDQVREAHIAIFQELKAAVEFESYLDPPRIEISVPDDAPTWGPDDAPVTVVEYSDFQCGYCRESHAVVQQLLAEFGDRVRFVYRDFAPATHPRALPAARAARCAGEQSRYWDYHDVLWTRSGNLSDDDLVRRAEGIALDMAEFRSCFESDRHTAEIAAAFEEGVRLGVSGTPTFFVNGMVLPGAQTFEALKSVIEDELKEVGA